MLARRPAFRGEHPNILCSKSTVHWPIRHLRASMRALHGRWIRSSAAVGGQANLWSRASHFSYNGNSNHRGDLPTDGPHDRLRLEGALFVSRFKSLPPSRLFHITADRVSVSVFLSSPYPILPFRAGRIPAGRSTRAKKNRRPEEHRLCCCSYCHSAFSRPGE